MTANEIKKEIERVKKAIFFEEMADFMNWRAYYQLNNELTKLKAELKKIEG